MHRRITAFCALILALAALLNPPARSVRADDTPPPPPHGVTLYPSDPYTGVQMVTESVVIEAAANRPDQIPYATVDATFLLRNNSTGQVQMTLRYPMSMIFYEETGRCDFSSSPSIRKFQVWVNERHVSYQIEREMVTNPQATPNKGPQKAERACWAIFSAVFNAGENVSIRVRFEQEAGVEGYPGYANYLFVLESGAGWDGPIEQAELTFRAPWRLSDETLLYYSPADGQVGDTEIHWQRGNFEPGTSDNILVQTVNPAVYQEINKGRKLYAGSKHGTAWGRYALAAKQAILGKRGFRDGAWGERLFHESFDAYTHAVELLPWDADWHAGFAELLCTNAYYPVFDLEWSDEERWSACAAQVQAALKINPRQELALRMVDWYGNPQIFALENGTPVYPILSVTPPPRRTLTPTPTETLVPSATPIPPTTTNMPTVTPTSTSAATQTATTAQLAAVEATTGPASASSKGRGSGTGLCGAVLLPLLSLIFVFRKRRSS